MEYKQKTNWTAFSWNNMLEKAEMKADVVFFGDSIIRGSNFHERYPSKRIINLGLSGDTLSGMAARVDMLKTLQPKQVFILGGINGLTNRNIEKSIKTYSRLLDNIKKNIPEADIYVHSLLPLSRKKEKSVCKNSTIITFNNQLSELTEKYDAIYIDLHSLYYKDGAMDPELTVDGLHLHPFAYERWANAIDNYIIASECVEKNI